MIMSNHATLTVADSHAAKPTKVLTTNSFPTSSPVSVDASAQSVNVPSGVTCTPVNAINVAMCETVPQLVCCKDYNVNGSDKVPTAVPAFPLTSNINYLGKLFGSGLGVVWKDAS